MLKGFFESISNFLSSLFGGGKKKEPKTKPVIPKPPVDVDDETLETNVQDASEVPADTVVVVNVEDVDLLEPIEEIDNFEEEDPFDGETVVTEPTSNTNTDSNTDSNTNNETDTGGSSSSEPTTETEPDPEPPTPKHKPRYLWCLDNGHGKKQAGKRSVVFDDGVTQFLEYEFNRDIVERIIRQLIENGVEYYDIVPDYEDVGSFLEGRVNRANAKSSSLPKLFVSIHSNAGGTGPDGWGAATGIETWYHHNSRKGKKIAAIFQKHLINEMGWRNRQLKSTAIKGLYILKETHMPAILTENGFFTNKQQAKELMKNSVRQRIADAHVAAIMEIEKNGL